MSKVNFSKVKNSDPVSYLSSQDPLLARVIAKVPRPVWERRNAYFRELVESIISQQLSEKAADTISKRFSALFSTKSFPDPNAILTIHPEKIRAAGISYAKISYIKDLAERVETKSLVLERLVKLPDVEVINELTKVKGIGRWTAEMFLIFGLGREDVFSYGDLGLRNAIQKLYRLRKPLTLQRAERISLRWKPYRSWACRYLWESLTLKESG